MWEGSSWPGPLPSLLLHHPFLCSVPPGSGLQVGISAAQESLSEQTELPPWKAAVLEFRLGMGLAIEAAPLSVPI